MTQGRALGWFVRCGPAIGMSLAIFAKARGDMAAAYLSAAVACAWTIAATKQGLPWTPLRVMGFVAGAIALVLGVSRLVKLLVE